MSDVIEKPKGALLSGWKERIESEFGFSRDKANLCSPTNSQWLCGNRIGRREAPDKTAFNFANLVEDLWRLLVVNWVEGGCNWRGSDNWRWELMPKQPPENRKGEVAMQRRLVQRLFKDRDKRWSNETPTASGLGPKGLKQPGGLDLAYSPDPSIVKMIELKKGADSPVSSAFQLMSYAFVLVLARRVHSRLVHKRGKIELKGPWRSATQTELFVLAPPGYYRDHPDLSWFQNQMNAALAGFRPTHDLALTFDFRVYDAEPTNSDMLLKALESKVQFQ